MLSFFALTALALAGVGLYGTLNYVVNLRRREVGLRLALGAMRTTIVRQFFVQGLKVIAIGCVAGVGAGVDGHAPAGGHVVRRIADGSDGDGGGDRDRDGGGDGRVVDSCRSRVDDRADASVTR